MNKKSMDVGFCGQLKLKTSRSFKWSWIGSFI